MIQLKYLSKSNLNQFKLATSLSYNTRILMHEKCMIPGRAKVVIQGNKKWLQVLGLISVLVSTMITCISACISACFITCICNCIIFFY